MEGQDKARAGALAGKLLTAAAVAAGAWLLFQGITRGIFSAIMGANSENGVYVLFYGGYIALAAAAAAIGLAAGWVFWRRAGRDAAPAGEPVPERSMLRSGITMGLALVAGAALLLGLFAWILMSV